MKIYAAIIDYNSFDYTKRLIQSLIKAGANVENLKLIIAIYVNGDKDGFNEDFLINLSNKNENKPTIKIFYEPFNSGYFGPLLKVQHDISFVDDIDFVIYANPDLEVREDFFSVLSNLADEDCALIAPRIINRLSNLNSNPMYLTRISKKKLLFLNLVYKSTILFVLYNFLHGVRALYVKKDVEGAQKSSTAIYAAHGSCIIFKDLDFFSQLPKHKNFLFGEELMIAEEARLNSKNILYIRDLVVSHFPSHSVKKLSFLSHRKYYSESIKNILSSYYAQ